MINYPEAHPILHNQVAGTMGLYKQQTGNGLSEGRRRKTENAEGAATSFYFLHQFLINRPLPINASWKYLKVKFAHDAPQTERGKWMLIKKVPKCETQIWIFDSSYLLSFEWSPFSVIECTGRQWSKMPFPDGKCHPFLGLMIPYPKRLSVSPGGKCETAVPKRSLAHDLFHRLCFSLAH